MDCNYTSLHLILFILCWLSFVDVRRPSRTKTFLKTTIFVKTITFLSANFFEDIKKLHHIVFETNIFFRDHHFFWTNNFIETKLFFREQFFPNFINLMAWAIFLLPHDWNVSVTKLFWDKIFFWQSFFSWHNFFSSELYLTQFVGNQNIF